MAADQKTKLGARAREIVKPHRMYCDTCVNNDTCENGGPFCDDCHETSMSHDDIAAAMVAFAREHAEKALRAARLDGHSGCMYAHEIKAALAAAEESE